MHAHVHDIDNILRPSADAPRRRCKKRALFARLVHLHQIDRGLTPAEARASQRPMGLTSVAAEAEMAAATAVAAAVATAAASVAAATPASAIAAATSEPSRAHAADLVLLGHLLASQLMGSGCSLKSDFAKVWKNVVVPVAAASRTDWQVGMCAEITASLVGRVSAHTLPAGTVGRIASRASDGERWQLLVDGPRGQGTVDIKQ